MFSLRTLWPFGGPARPWLDHYPAGVPANLEYPREPLGWLLENAAARFPGRVACRYYSQRITYDEMLSRARRLAALLVREGLQPGDRVALLLPNLPEYIITLFGTWMAGGVVVALSPLMIPEEVAALIKATGCRIVVSLDVLAPLLRHPDHHPNLVLLTSLQGRLPWLEQLGYTWVRFQRNGFGHACNGAPVRVFDETIDATRDVITPVAIDIEKPAYILPTGGTTGAP